jgi:hypothetical protein
MAADLKRFFGQNGKLPRLVCHALFPLEAQRLFERLPHYQPVGVNQFSSA